MTDGKDQAFSEARDAAESGSARMLEMVLERLGMNTGARAVFGEAIERDGRTVIPVAQSIIGIGAGVVARPTKEAAKEPVAAH